MSVLHQLSRLFAELNARRVRALVVGVSGVNFYARTGHTIFATEDQDLLLPTDPATLLSAWEACEARGLELFANQEPLDSPHDLFLAQRVARLRATTRATDGDLLHVDLTFVFGAFSFEEVWERRKVFTLEGVEVSVASLADIVRAKASAGRMKDRMFLTSHEAALREWLREESEGPPPPP